MFKKTLAMILSITLVLGLAGTVYAEESNVENNYDQAVVEGTSEGR